MLICLQSVYLVIISFVNEYYKGMFFEIESIWTSGKFCKCIGCLMNFSILCSTGSLFWISFQRFFVIIYPMSKLLTKLLMIKILIGNFILSFILAVFPVFFLKVIN